MLDLPSDFRVLTSTITVTLAHQGSTTHPSEFYYCCQILPHLRTRANLTAALEQWLQPSEMKASSLEDNSVLHGSLVGVQFHCHNPGILFLFSIHQITMQGKIWHWVILWCDAWCRCCTGPATFSKECATTTNGNINPSRLHKQGLLWHLNHSTLQNSWYPTGDKYDGRTQDSLSTTQVTHVQYDKHGRLY